MDPQGNTTSGLGVDKNSLEKSIYSVLLGETFITDVMRDTPVPLLSLIPAEVALAGAEIELFESGKREYILNKILKEVKFAYDYVIIDCPPSLNILTVNALTAADTVIVPLQCEFFALEGLTQLFHTIDLIKKRTNNRLKVEGIVFTMYDGRTNLSMQVVDEVKRFVPSDIYKCIIPRNIRLSEAPSHGLPITLYDRTSKGAEGYIQLAGLVDESGGI
jgi:chromosome partitioning protein